jgi:hypothetical protein
MSKNKHNHPETKQVKETVTDAVEQPTEVDEPVESAEEVTDEPTEEFPDPSDDDLTTDEKKKVALFVLTETGEAKVAADASAMLTFGVDIVPSKTAGSTRVSAKYTMTAPGEEKFAKAKPGGQVALIYGALKDGADDLNSITNAIGAQLATRQDPKRVVAFYLAKWKSEGLIEVAK